MPHEFGSDLQINQNQLLGARLELRTALFVGPYSGRFGFVSSSLAGYDGVDMTGRPLVALVDGAASLAEYRVFPGLNQNESIVGRWTFAPSQAGSTSVGLNTVPTAPTIPQTIANFPPFGVGGQSRLPTGWDRNPDTDGLGDLVQPVTGPKRYVQSWVKHLGADRLDGYDASLAVDSYLIPVRAAGGQLRVPLDPTDPDHATSKQYVDNNRAGIRTRTSATYVTTAALPSYTYNGTSRLFTASANGALSVDGTTPAVGDRIIVRNEADQTKNCIATVVVVGNGSTPWQVRKVYGKLDDGDPSDNPDPDNLGSLAYGDYVVATAGATMSGSTWTASGGTAGDVVTEANLVIFNLFQLSQALSSGRGVLVSGGKVHFWKAAYSGADILTFPYLAADANGSAAINSVAMYGASGAFALRGTANRIPKSAAADGLFRDSLLSDDGTAIFPASSAPLGKSGSTWSQLWLAPGATAAKLTKVAGWVTTDQVVHRSWATFMSDVSADLAGNFVAPSLTLQVFSPDSSLTVSPSAAVDLAANRAWSLAVNWASGKPALGLDGAYSDYSIPQWVSSRFTDSPLSYGATWSGSEMFRSRVLAIEAGILEAQFMSRSPSVPVWFKLADLPATSTSVDDLLSVIIRGGYMGQRDRFSVIEAYLGNRNHDTGQNLVHWRFTGAHAAATPESQASWWSIEMRRAVDGTASVWLKISSNFVTVVASVMARSSMGGFASATVTKSPIGTTTAPTDAIVFNTAAPATYPPNMRIDVGTLAVRAPANTGPLASVAGFLSGSSVLNARPWANFISEISAAIGTGSLVPTSRTLTLVGGTAMSVSPNTAQDLSANRSFTITNTAPFPGFEAPTVTVKLSAAAGSSAAALRSDAQLALDQGIVPTWTGRHTFSVGLTLGVGTTTVAPVLFGAAANALLTAAAAGALECDLASSNPNGRLWFTDGLPLRHGIAFIDDIGFTNDPAAAEQPGIRFFGPVSAVTCQADLKQSLGTSPFTAYVRVRVPDRPLGSSAHFPVLFMVHSATSPDATYIGAHLLVDGRLSFLTRLGVDDGVSSIVGFVQKYAGQIVDVVLIRESSGIRAYINGIQQTISNATDVRWQRSLSANCEFRPGMLNGANTNSWVDRIYRATLFNRALSTAEVQRLSRHGVEDSDRWGSTAAVYTASWASTVDGWSAATGGGSNPAVARVAGPIGGRSNLLRLTVGTTGTQNYATRGTLTRARRYRLTGDIYIPTANAQSDGVQFAAFGAAASSANIVPTRDTWTTITVDGQDDLNLDSTANWIVHLSRAGSIAYTGNGADLVYLSSFVVTQVGCLCDLDFSIGYGAVIPDRSGRYPARLTGAYEWTLARSPAVGVPIDPTDADPLDSTSGDGIVYGTVRKVVLRRTFTDDQTRTITHGLGVTASLTVALWDDSASPPRQISCGVEAASANAVTVAVGKIGGGKTLRVVITG